MSNKLWDVECVAGSTEIDVFLFHDSSNLGTVGCGDVMELIGRRHQPPTWWFHLMEPLDFNPIFKDFNCQKIAIGILEIENKWRGSKWQIVQVIETRPAAANVAIVCRLAFQTIPIKSRLFVYFFFRLIR